jgi:hypothetical protein
LREFQDEVIDLSEHDPFQCSNGGKREEDDDQSSRSPTDAQTFQERAEVNTRRKERRTARARGTKTSRPK